MFRMLKSIVFIAAVCSACAALAQSGAKRPITFEDMMKLKRVSDPVVSPDGKWVMYSVTDVDLQANTKRNHLWLVPVAGGEAKQITSSAPS